MKLLILSFFAVILGYSLLFNEKEEISQPIHGIDNSVYIHKSVTPRVDSVAIYHNKTASVLQKYS